MKLGVLSLTKNKSLAWNRCHLLYFSTAQFSLALKMPSNSYSHHNFHYMCKCLFFYTHDRPDFLALIFKGAIYKDSKLTYLLRKACNLYLDLLHSCLIYFLLQYKQKGVTVSFKKSHFLGKMITTVYNLQASRKLVETIYERSFQYSNLCNQGIWWKKGP